MSTPTGSRSTPSGATSSPPPPAPLTHAHVDGLAVTRRRPDHDGRPDHDVRADHDVVSDQEGATLAVVLVHGAMDRAASFGRVMRRLGDLDVCAYDRRGYAASLDAGSAPTLDDQAEDLRWVCEWTQAARVVVVGHSFGGTVAMRLAESTPPWLAAIGAFESPAPSLGSYRSDGADLALAAGETGGPIAAAEAFYRLVVGDAVWDGLREKDRHLRQAEGVQLVAEFLDLRRADGAPNLAAVLLPVVVGVGSDSVPEWKASAHELADTLSGSSLVEIPGAGHGAHLTHADEFARFVRTCVAAAG
ncbi:MAG TPA: alpha/beta hydrolase [Microthrixaceae bacterium]|nr:alpha/beta hydrolase [Microthrixaceae bacterium]